MPLYDFKQVDIDDVLMLLRSPNLTINASNALRLVELQSIFSTAKPSKEFEECKARAEKLEQEVRESLRVRDTALLEASLANRRLDELRELVASSGPSGDVSAADVAELVGVTDAHRGKESNELEAKAPAVVDRRKFPDDF